MGYMVVSCWSAVVRVLERRRRRGGGWDVV